ncbi:hypothetical protein RSal33209_2813 [Renibacterium salmoninarum ATCC 33209]|uniref:Glycosyl hydrolase family 92 domain-containing protein n=1 Tax=Renibacterium salmoninarum (strain ATCC 33209 / DSM 20767 / JCM 11484 / NBRC 15589 / NCIMB 2235) TaxID=288705 RepID=A9WTL6_RENSM|nr:hypothetical protein RSal33209_2813 [Renibacterium salmoninarum ATCC 33209]
MMLKNVDGTPPEDSQFPGWAGNTSYLEKGYIPADAAYNKKGQDDDRAFPGSATMEYALADCSVALVAQGQGDTPNAQALRERGGNWANVWDPQLSSQGETGFPRVRNVDGSWGQGDPTSANVGCQEGTPWQYQWLTMQDMPGLIKAQGGDAKTVSRLDAFFDLPGIMKDPEGTARKSWVIGALNYDNSFRFNPNNEPDTHTPWLYDYVGQPAKASAVSSAAQSLFVNKPSGVTGNDDLGAMSSWYVFAALGIYPGMFGTGDFLLSAPSFSSATLKLPEGKVLTLSAPTAKTDKLQFIDALNLGGQSIDRSHLNWSELKAGGDLKFTLGTDSDSAWETSATARPKSPCTSVPTIANVPPLSAEVNKSLTAQVATIDAKPSLLTGARAEVVWKNGSKNTAEIQPQGMGQIVTLKQSFNNSGLQEGVLNIFDGTGAMILSTNVTVQVSEASLPAVTPTPTVPSGESAHPETGPSADTSVSADASSDLANTGASPALPILLGILLLIVGLVLLLAIRRGRGAKHS